MQWGVFIFYKLLLPLFYISVQFLPPTIPQQDFWHPHTEIKQSGREGWGEGEREKLLMSSGRLLWEPVANESLGFPFYLDGALKSLHGHTNKFPANDVPMATPVTKTKHPQMLHPRVEKRWISRLWGWTVGGNLSFFFNLSRGLEIPPPPLLQRHTPVFHVPLLLLKSRAHVGFAVAASTASKGDRADIWSRDAFLHYCLSSSVQLFEQLFVGSTLHQSVSIRAFTLRLASFLQTCFLQTANV